MVGQQGLSNRVTAYEKLILGYSVVHVETGLSWLGLDCEYSRSMHASMEVL